MLFRFCLLVICLSGVPLFAQQWEWVNQVGNTSGNTIIHKIRPYGNDQLLIAGTFGVSSLQLGGDNHSNNGQEDAFVAVCNQEGTYLWSTVIGGTGEDAATAVAADIEGNIYVAGSFNSLTLQIGSFTLTNQGDKDIFVVKIKSDKKIEWAIRLGTSNTDEVIGIEVEKSGKIYLGGHYINSFNGPQDRAFIMAINPAGTILWQKMASINNGSVVATSFAMDSINGCYLAGSYSGRLSFDGGGAINTTVGMTGFIMKYNTNGGFVNAFSSTSIAKFNDISIRGNQVMTCGENIKYGLGWGWPLSDSKIYLSRFNTNLSLVWEKSAGGTYPFQSLDIAQSLSVDEQGNTYLTGYFFGPKLGFAEDSLPNIFNKDYYYQQIFLLKYDATGNEIWGKALGGSLTDQGTAIYAVGNDNLILAGVFESDSIALGSHQLYNNGALRQVYVHLRPFRYSRNAIAFLSSFRARVTSTINNSIEKLLLFPNPVRDIIRLQVSDLSFIPEYIQIFSLDGRLLEAKSYTLDNEDFLEDVSQFPSGTYFIVLSGKERQALAKFVKN
jgi:hypothetical protein